jgi:choline dehydrogenase
VLAHRAVPGLSGRDLAYPRGKVLGGSSAINAMIYMRGQAADYDRWRQMGLTGWGWDDVLPIFRKHEDNWEILDAFIAAAEQAGSRDPPTSTPATTKAAATST